MDRNDAALFAEFLENRKAFVCLQRLVDDEFDIEIKRNGPRSVRDDVNRFSCKLTHLPDKRRFHTAWVTEQRGPTLTEAVEAAFNDARRDERVQ